MTNIGEDTEESFKVDIDKKTVATIFLDKCLEKGLCAQMNSLS